MAYNLRRSRQDFCKGIIRFMLAQFTPALIMFGITVAFVSLFCVPITAFPMKNKLINFYWAGFWFFLMMIAAFSGSMNALMLAQIDAEGFGTVCLTTLTLCFTIFVAFGWFRLSSKALATGISRGLQKLKVRS